MANPNPSNKIKKGETRNPKGRPKNKEAISNIVEEVGNKVIDPKKDKRTYWQALSERLFKNAAFSKEDNAATQAAKYLLDRRYGKPRETVDANVNGNLTVNIKKYEGE